MVTGKWDWKQKKLKVYYLLEKYQMKTYLDMKAQVQS